eukprot:5573995-Prorocentrum_lima.AAC.1
MSHAMVALLQDPRCDTKQPQWKPGRDGPFTIDDVAAFMRAHCGINVPDATLSDIDVAVAAK